MGTTTLVFVLPHGNVPPSHLAWDSGNPDPGSEKRKRTVLVVDDEPLIADTLAEILNDSGNFVAVASYNGKRALEQVRNAGFDILITDVLMPQMNGIELAKTIRTISPKTRIVLLSGQAQTRDLLEEARYQGHSFELWAKPIHPDLLLQRLTQTQ